VREEFDLDRNIDRLLARFASLGAAR
jgi:hypothetical protein